FYGAMNYVSPMFLRLESDEATYNLHIILRYELERAMVTGDLRVADLPEAWNAKVKDYLGLTVTDDALGCLQDTHWSGGMIGYFPTYTLGNLYSAMWFDTAVTEMPDLAEDFTRGDFSRMLGWLRENIHRHAKRYRATELCEKVTGRPLSHDPMITYLTEKYREIYGF
ncbi:carboxypeptidase M32, partial [candidate division GN15 bacterium]|nr:carboxypeptidase M32 [candidate division GN15 bacterium]